jgi:diaminopropionate ammonia-lyase
MTTPASALPCDCNPGGLQDGHHATSLLEIPQLAKAAGVARVFLKNEAERPLGNFKVLGGVAAAVLAVKRRTDALSSSGDSTSPVPHLTCASDGNHGLAVAWAAQREGIRATVYLPACANPARVRRIQAMGARAILVTGTYDDAVLAAQTAALQEHALLVADTSPDPHDRVVRDVMTGYGRMTDEIAAQFAALGDVQPTHAFIQAGVGGLAAAVSEGLFACMRGPVRVIVVEPSNAACVARALEQRRPVRIAGALETIADMLSCGLASAPAIEILLRHGARSLLVDEKQLEQAPVALQAAGGPASTPSGAAGVAGLLAASADARMRDDHGLGADSIVLLCNTEGAVAPG